MADDQSITLAVPFDDPVEMDADCVADERPVARPVDIAQRTIGRASGHLSVDVNRRSDPNRRPPGSPRRRNWGIVSASLQLGGLHIQFIGQPAQCVANVWRSLRQISQGRSPLPQESDVIDHNGWQTSDILR
jgi:hypothetical protein